MDPHWDFADFFADTASPAALAGFTGLMPNVDFASAESALAPSSDSPDDGGDLAALLGEETPAWDPLATDAAEEFVGARAPSAPVKMGNSKTIFLPTTPSKIFAPAAGDSDASPVDEWEERTADENLLDELPSATPASPREDAATPEAADAEVEADDFGFDELFDESPIPDAESGSPSPPSLGNASAWLPAAESAAEEIEDFADFAEPAAESDASPDAVAEPSAEVESEDPWAELTSPSSEETNEPGEQTSRAKRTNSTTLRRWRIRPLPN